MPYPVECGMTQHALCIVGHRSTTSITVRKPHVGRMGYDNDNTAPEKQGQELPRCAFERCLPPRVATVAENIQPLCVSQGPHNQIFHQRYLEMVEIKRSCTSHR